MKHKFKLSLFPESTFTITTSIWTGKMKLFKDDIKLEQSKDPGKPYLIPTEDGQYIKAFRNRSFANLTPGLIINDQVIQVVEKLKWYQYTMAIVPLLLCLIGGAIGGLIGGLCAYLVLYIFMKEQDNAIAYVKAIIPIAVSYVLYFFAALEFMKLIQ
ncbi:hypothetical protein OQY15_16195 [Pedobacter sp. MC2016-15]|uniref:hypothetical protein n=1 Tax=Pedobacter sp. MC2016-15 TaxID=2994473 RepID=UPI002247F091|nr:hypothetical protein [Pedobacter sp. MC2016-15]MCX2480647.1 hypothetical protein [Pedobacter sp. MC2016-15]